MQPLIDSGLDDIEEHEGNDQAELDKQLSKLALGFIWLPAAWTERVVKSAVYRSIPQPARWRHQLQTRIAMGLFRKDIKTMDDLFLHTLQDIYYAENKIVKSLPDMIENARDAELKQGLQAHLGETKGHVKRLEQVFQMLGQKPKAVTCPAIDGIIDEADDITGEVDDKDVLDAAIIAAGQAVEHYEMTRYGSLIAWAKRLGRADVARILDQTLTEEKAADKKLTTIAETKVNLRAAS
jgi:ferritin-like metal-binding protein YciE